MKSVLIVFLLLTLIPVYSQTVFQRELSKKLHGEWLGEEYLNRIEKSKSVFANKDYQTEIWGFVLDSANLLSDSAFLQGFHTHEGGYDSYVQFNELTNEFQSNANKNEEHSNFHHKDFTLQLENEKLIMVFSKNGKKDVYRKVVSEQVELRRIIFNQTFNNQTNEKITFSEDGSLVGFHNFTYFEVVYDFTDESTFDMIYCFQSKKKPPTCYKFDFKGKNLILKKAYTNQQTLETTISKEAIILTTVEN